MEAYCGHAHSAHVIAKAIRAADPEDLQRYNKLLGMACRESKAIMALSSKLRLAPQYTIRSDKVLAKQPSRKPWEWIP